MRAAANGRPAIGIYWHSDADAGEGKSVPLYALLPLLEMAEVHWVVLQRGFGRRRLIAAGLQCGMTVVDADLTFDETAALIARLDGVVSICASIFHLAAALGVRSCLLAGRVLHSRHENRERESVLYPGIATLARQPTHGDWRGAVMACVADIRRWIANRSGGLPGHRLEEGLP